MAAGSLVLAGCATRVVEFPAPPPRDPISARAGRPGLVVAAPGGASDAQAAAIAADVARRTGFGLVVGGGADGEPDRGYERRVREIAQGPLRFYAEIHGSARRESANRIEIAAVGVDREYAQRLRALCELIRDAHLRGHAAAPRLDVLVEPADPVRAAAGARGDGILRLAGRGLSIELPRAARVEFRQVYTAILADFVAQAVTLPKGR